MNTIPIKQDIKVPKICYLIILSGLIYALIGILSFIIYPEERKITHLPAWFRRLIDGLFTVLLGLYALKNPNRRPLKGWFENSWILWYSLFSLVVHYGGMLPPIYLYDKIPIFNKIMHINASIVILLLSTYGCERRLPQLFDIIFTSLIGIIWEITEYLTTPDDINYWKIIDVGFGWHDTKWDMIANIIGIILGYITCRYKRRIIKLLINNF